MSTICTKKQILIILHTAVYTRTFLKKTLLPNAANSPSPLNVLLQIIHVCHGQIVYKVRVLYAFYWKNNKKIQLRIVLSQIKF